MKKTTAAVMLTLTTFFSITAVKAQGIDMRGVPNCGDWLESRKSDSSLSSFGNNAVLVGMLNGINMTYYFLMNKQQEKQMFGEGKPNNQQLFAWMDKFCRENPLKSVADGAFTLFSEVTNTPSMIKPK